MRRRRPSDFQAIAFFAIVGLVVHGIFSLRVGFMADDYDLLRAAALTPSSYGLLDAFPAGPGCYFRPLVMATLRAEMMLASDSGSPLLHHATNLFLHIANTSLIYVVASQIDKPIIRWRSGLAFALVFLLHPVVVSNVCWISGRTDSLCLFFCLLSIHALREAHTNAKRGAAIGALALLMCALASKETAIVLPLLWLGVHLLSSKAKTTTTATTTRVILLGCLISVAWLIMLWLRFYGALPRENLPLFTVRTLVRGIAAIPAVLLIPNSEALLRRILGEHRSIIALTAVLGLLILLLVLRRAARVTDADARTKYFGAFILVISVFLPQLLSGVNATSRLMYIPLAAICIAGSALIEPKQKHVWGWAIALAVMAFGSIRGDSRWLHNSELTQSYCSEYKSALETRRRPRRAALFLTYPAESDSVPLFANDLESALDYCEYGSFGPRIDSDNVLISIAPVEIETTPSSTSDERLAAIERISPHVIFANAARLDIVFNFEPRTADLHEIKFVGDSHVFEARLSDRADELYDIYAFDGRHLRKL